MDGDPLTQGVESNDAESTQTGVSECSPTNCKYENENYKLECAECKGLVHYGFTSPRPYQLQLFLRKGYRKFIFCKCVEIPSYLHAIPLNQNKAYLKTVIKKLEGELRERRTKIH